MNARVQARVTHRFAASPERVFDAWLRPDVIRRWMREALLEMGLPGDVTTVRVDPRVGGAFEFADRRPEGVARHWGTYVTLDRPRALAFTWIVDAADEDEPSVVTISFARDGGGCRVELVHDLPAKWAEYVGRTEEGWSRMLTAIDALPAPA